MATNTLQDLNSLPVTEKMSECKASLTKPCVGKMNGKSDDRPLPSSVVSNPSLVETEKPEAEKATVEVEYIESQNLNNVDDADAVLKVHLMLCASVCYDSINSISITTTICP